MPASYDRTGLEELDARIRALPRVALADVPSALEAAERLDAVVLDKTGTITEGKPQVDGIFPASGYSEEQLLRLAAAVERGSEHPLGAAITAAAAEREITVPNAEGFEAAPGQGARATVAGAGVVVGI